MSVEAENDSAESPEVPYGKPTTCVLTNGHWVSLGGGVQARMPTSSDNPPVQRVIGGSIELKISQYGLEDWSKNYGPILDLINPVNDVWFDVKPYIEGDQPHVQVMRIGPNVLRSRVRGFPKS